MNEEHLRLCSSIEWSKHIERTLLPWALDGGVDLGNDLIEVGPGPGLTTDLLRRKVQRLTAVEADKVLAHALSDRLIGTNVDVIHTGAAQLPFEDGRFSAAASFTMLHHVPSIALQDQLLAELARVLRPGGMLVGVDSIDSPAFRELHRGCVCVPINPLNLADRLRQAGFSEVAVTVWTIGIRFMARTPQRGNLS